MGKPTIKTRVLNNFRKLLMNEFCEKTITRVIKKQNSFYHFFTKLVPPNYLYKAKSNKKIYIKNINLIVDISDYVGHYLYFGFRDMGYEKLCSIASQNDVIIDIGANIGFTALSLSKKIGNNGMVYAFEPDPQNFNELKNNINLNDSLKINIYNIGLSEKKDKLKLSVCEEKNRGMNRVNNSVENNFTWIEVDSLDNFVNANNLKKINLIKIDVEGFELNVLKGAEKSLKQFKPKLFIELDDNNLKEQGNSAKELIDYLFTLGYKITSAETNEIINSGANFSNCHYDIICESF